MLNTKDVVSEAKIYTAYVNKNTKWIFLNLKLSSGIEGWGEATLNKSEKKIEELANNKLHNLIGLPFSHLNNEIQELFNFSDTPNAVLTSAINSSLVDIISQKNNISLANQLGGLNYSEVEVYANFNRRTKDRSLEGIKKSVQFVKQNGFTAFKIAPFDEVFPSNSKSEIYNSITNGIQRIEVIRNVIGKDARLMIDCHWRFNTNSIDVLIEEILPFNIYWLECPIKENIEAIPMIKLIRNKVNKKGIRLAGLETCLTKTHFQPFLEKGCYDIVMPDVKYVGGPLKMMELASYIGKYDIQVSPHNPSGPICHAHSLQICGALKAPTILEHQFDESPLFNKLVFNKLPNIKNGKVKLSEDPGIGIKINKNLNLFKSTNKKSVDSNKTVFDDIANLSGSVR